MSYFHVGKIEMNKTYKCSEWIAKYFQSTCQELKVLRMNVSNEALGTPFYEALGTSFYETLGTSWSVWTQPFIYMALILVEDQKDPKVIQAVMTKKIFIVFEWEGGRTSNITSSRGRNPL
jgi:hypothetical protein